mmetsp:Transcript_6370/g.18815  ORF Transcript_6370/g.18815 Transcript_6370/m.18815 type:complete len:207 (-) Transcript_6370:285-905(-)
MVHRRHCRDVPRRQRIPIALDHCCRRAVAPDGRRRGHDRSRGALVRHRAVARRELPHDEPVLVDDREPGAVNIRLGSKPEEQVPRSLGGRDDSARLVLLSEGRVEGLGICREPEAFGVPGHKFPVVVPDEAPRVLLGKAFPTPHPSRVRAAPFAVATGILQEELAQAARRGVFETGLVQRLLPPARAAPYTRDALEKEAAANGEAL